MEKYVTLNAKVRRTKGGYAITIFINDGLLEKSKQLAIGVKANE